MSKSDQKILHGSFYKATANLLSPIDSGIKQSLFLMIMEDALEMAGRKASVQDRAAKTLHPFTTRALFTGTEEKRQHMTQAELLQILLPQQSKSTEMLDARQLRHFISIGSERGMKLPTHRNYVLELLKGKAVSNADAARSWAYALIHQAAMIISISALKKQVALDFSNFKYLPYAVVEPLLKACDEELTKVLLQHMEKSKIATEQNHPDGEYLEFIDHAAWMVLEEMRRPINAFAAHHALLKNVYFEIDKYQFN